MSRVVKNRFRLDLVEDAFINSYYVQSDNLAELEAYLKSWGVPFSYPKLYDIIFRNFDRNYFVDLEIYLDNDPRLSSDPAHFTEYDELISYDKKLSIVKFFLDHLNYDLQFQTPIELSIELSRKSGCTKKINELKSLLDKAERNTIAYHNIIQKIDNQLENHSTKIKK